MTTSIAGSARRGVTLIELMVVLSIIGIMLGIGLAFLNSASRDMEFRATVGQVRSLLRYARSEAVAQHSSACVEVDPQAHEMRAVTKRPIGLWHFEDKVTTGAFGHDGKMNGGQLVKGKIGSALALTPRDGVDCGDLGVFRPDQGILIEAWLFLNSATRQSIFTCDGEYSLGVNDAGGLVGEAGGKHAAAAAAQVPVHRWFEARLIYDGRAVVLKQNDLVVGASDDDAKTGTLPDNGSHFVIGGAKGGVDGIVDEVRVSAILPTETRKLPDSVAIVADAPVTIWFDDRGRLDRAHHGEPATLTLTWEKESETFTVGWLGTVRSETGEPPEAAETPTPSTKDAKDPKSGKGPKSGNADKKGAQK